MNRFIYILLTVIFTCTFVFSAYADDPKGSPSLLVGASAGKVDKAAMLEAYKAQQWEQVVRIGEILTTTTGQSDGSVWAMLGVSYFSIANYEKALNAFQQEALAVGSNDQNLRNIAFCSIRLNKNNACELGKQAVERFPNDAMLHNEAGKVCLKQKKPEDAIPLLQKAIELEPKSAIYVTDLTQYYFNHKDNANAEIWTAKGIRNGLEMATLYINVTLACYRQEKYEEAIQWADEGVAKTRDPLLLYHKGRALIRLGRMEEAEATLNAALKEGVLFSQYLLAKVMMYNACSADQYATCATAKPDPCCQKETEALRLFAAAEEDQLANDTYEEYAAYYGLALILNGKFDQAEPLIRRVAKDKKNFTQALLSASLAIASWNMTPRDDAMARRYYDEAIQTSDVFADLDNEKWVQKLIPARAMATLHAIADSQKVTIPQKTKKPGGCGCDMNQTPAAPGVWALLIAAAMAFLIRKRKRSH